MHTASMGVADVAPVPTTLAARVRLAVLAAGLFALPSIGVPAAAAVFELRYTGWLSAADTLLAPDGTDLLTGDTEFEFVARFDDSSPDLVAVLPFPGFVAYSAENATIEILGQSYTMTSFADDPAYGIGVSLFDPTNPIFPGFYGVGFIANPLADGAGIIGDFGSASPGFSVLDIGPATFGGFRGAGYLNGIGCSPVSPGPCVPQAIQIRSAGGEVYALNFAFSNRDAPPSHFAEILAVPEPATWAMMIAGFGAVGIAARRRRLGRA